jgi:hypothetical protein
MHEHDMVYSNNLPLNHDIAVHPALHERRLVVGVGKQRLLLLLGTFMGEMSSLAAVVAFAFLVL